MMNPIAHDKQTRKTQIRLRRSFMTESFLKDHGAWLDVIEFSGGLVRFADPSARPLHGVPVTLWLDVTEISDLRSVLISCSACGGDGVVDTRTIGKSISIARPCKRCNGSGEGSAR